VTCPYCGHDGTEQEFTAPEDVEAAKEHVKWAAAQDVADAIAGIVSGFNRKQSTDSPISISMSMKHSHEPAPYFWREDLLRALRCDLCERSYGVYAIAIFCPDCGGRNVHVHFAREVELIEKQVHQSEEIAAKGDNELAYRMLGNAHEDVLTALETYF
jgi:uncharacterized Zn finger protein (UPF0148 family)